MTENTDIRVASVTASAQLISMIAGNPESSHALGSRSPSGVEGAKWLLAMQGQSDLRVEDLNGEPFHVVDWMAHRVSLTDPTSGESRESVRLVLMDVEGRTLSCVSDVACRDWSTVVGCLGPGPYDDSIAVTIRSVRTRNGRVMYQLRLV